MRLSLVSNKHYRIRSITDVRLFVGNLPFTTQEHELRTLFESFGPVTDCRIVSDRETGKSRGFGFVEMSDQHANKAIPGLDGIGFGGRALKVNEAQPRPEQHGNGGHHQHDNGRKGDRRERVC